MEVGEEERARVLGEGGRPRCADDRLAAPADWIVGVDVVIVADPSMNTRDCAGSVNSPEPVVCAFPFDEMRSTTTPSPGSAPF